MKKKTRMLFVLAMSLSLGVGAYFSHPGSARAEKCNPKDPETCVGGPTGPEQTCGQWGQPCCPAPFPYSPEDDYCTDPKLYCTVVVDGLYSTYECR
ncbi:MAG TPA: hypothetical protein VIA18_16055 [Polyangia bacterium]|jgi:hypothetical protein|nr:hypothetical protein [Polyangia bacterium]